MIELISRQLESQAGQLTLTPESFRAIAESLKRDEISAVNFLLAVDLLEREARKVCSSCAGPANARRRAGQPYYWQSCQNCQNNFDSYLRELYRDQN